MNTDQNLTFASRIVITEKQTADPSAVRERRFWITALAVCGLGGMASGITGLMLSLLTAAGVLAKTRDLSLTVTILIVSSLGLLLCGAHAMDRIE